MGKVGFGELAFWLATQRRPTPGETRVFEAVLAALADHGFTPTAIVTRLTYLSRAGLGAGRARRRAARRRLAVPRRHRGLRPVPARRARRATAQLPADDAGWDALALRRRDRSSGRRSGSSRASATTCTRTATRARRGCSRSPREEGLRGPHLSLFAAIGRVHPQVLGKTLPLNGAGVCGAALADLGLPLELLRGFALLARTAGLIGQLAEELRNPVGERHLPVRRPEQRRTVPIRPQHRRHQEVSMAELVAVIASTHHPFYYRASTADRRGPAAVRRRVGAQGRGVPRDADPARARTCW